MMKNVFRMMGCAALLASGACTADGLTGPSPVEAEAALAAVEAEPAAAEVEAAPNPAPQPTVILRCRGSIRSSGGSAPLFVLDGQVADSAAIRRLGTTAIERIEVLRGAEAAAIYGSHAANGVVVITTRR